MLSIENIVKGPLLKKPVAGRLINREGFSDDVMALLRAEFSGDVTFGSYLEDEWNSGKVLKDMAEKVAERNYTYAEKANDLKEQITLEAGIDLFEGAGEGKRKEIAESYFKSQIDEFKPLLEGAKSEIVELLVQPKLGTAKDSSEFASRFSLEEIEKILKNTEGHTSVSFDYNIIEKLKPLETKVDKLQVLYLRFQELKEEGDKLGRLGVYPNKVKESSDELKDNVVINRALNDIASEVNIRTQNYMKKVEAFNKMLDFQAGTTVRLGVGNNEYAKTVEDYFRLEIGKSKTFLENNKSEIFDKSILPMFKNKTYSTEFASGFSLKEIKTILEKIRSAPQDVSKASLDTPYNYNIIEKLKPLENKVNSLERLYSRFQELTNEGNQLELFENNANTAKELIGNLSENYGIKGVSNYVSGLWGKVKHSFKINPVTNFLSKAKYAVLAIPLTCVIVGLGVVDYIHKPSTERLNLKPPTELVSLESNTPYRTIELKEAESKLKDAEAATKAAYQKREKFNRDLEELKIIKSEKGHRNPWENIKTLYARIGGSNSEVSNVVYAKSVNELCRSMGIPTPAEYDKLTIDGAQKKVRNPHHWKPRDKLKLDELSLVKLHQAGMNGELFAAETAKQNAKSKYGTMLAGANSYKQHGPTGLTEVAMAETAGYNSASKGPKPVSTALPNNTLERKVALNNTNPYDSNIYSPIATGAQKGAEEYSPGKMYFESKVGQYTNPTPKIMAKYNKIAERMDDISSMFYDAEGNRTATFKEIAEAMGCSLSTACRDDKRIKEALSGQNYLIGLEESFSILNNKEFIGITKPK